MVSVSFRFNYGACHQAGALVHVYADGEVLITHGGTEMGQVRARGGEGDSEVTGVDDGGGSGDSSDDDYTQLLFRVCTAFVR